jgi:hypothetical protein
MKFLLTAYHLSSYLVVNTRGGAFMLIMMAVFWVVAPCSMAIVYQRFRGPCCLHHQGDEAPLKRW